MYSHTLISEISQLSTSGILRTICLGNTIGLNTLRPLVSILQSPMIIPIGRNILGRLFNVTASSMDLYVELMSSAPWCPTSTIVSTPIHAGATKTNCLICSLWFQDSDESYPTPHSLDILAFLLLYGPYVWYHIPTSSINYSLAVETCIVSDFSIVSYLIHWFLHPSVATICGILRPLSNAHTNMYSLIDCILSTGIQSLLYSIIKMLQTSYNDTKNKADIPITYINPISSIMSYH